VSGSRKRILFAGLALLALAVFIALGTREPATTDVKHAGLQKEGIPSQRNPTAASGVYAMESAPSRPAAPPAVTAPRPQAPPVPFSFLGKVTENGKVAIHLYRGGRTFAVRGTGRLDDDYEVESIQESFLVLRYVPLGEQQVFELAAPRQAAVAYETAADTAQD
jgi:hypothetical protein